MMDANGLSGLFSRVKTIALIGAKDKPGQPVDRVGRYLMDSGFTVFPVHPVRKSVWGLEAYPTMLDVPAPVDLVNLFRAPEYCPDHAREALKLDPLPLAFWMQSGIKSAEVRDILSGHPITVIEDRCIMVDHRANTSGGLV
ncbi:MAG: CoA-binding protein [Desulfovibrionales bacterium]